MARMTDLLQRGSSMSGNSSTGRNSAFRMMLAAAAGVAASLASGVLALGEEWPERAIKAVSPISAGSANDVITRTVLEHVSARLGQPIVVENRTGGDGTIGTAAVARAQPDGYTILSHSAALVVSPATQSYDMLRD